MPEKTLAPGAASLRENLEWLRRIRGRDAAEGPPARLAEVRQWQAARLKRSHADLIVNPRHREAAHFFLEDLYGPKDFSARDEEMLRILPTMVRLLPALAVETAALAIEVDARSEALDRQLAHALGADTLDDRSYGRAFRESSTPAERERQIVLIEDQGKRLDRLVTKPLLGRTLRLMRAPARLAGLADLQQFLERGFAAFRAIGGAEEFLGTLGARERRIASRLFSGAADPFSPRPP